MGVAYVVGQLLPHLQLRLKQAYIKDDATEYLAKTLFYSIIVFLAASTLLVPLAGRVGKADYRMALGLSLVFSAFAFAYRMLLPNTIIKTRMADIERNLVFALQSLYVQITSGVLLLHAMAAISQGKYGQISREFKVAVDEAESGIPLSDALENLARRNPSPHFQRMVRQITNTINTGGDLADALDHMTQSLSHEQLTSIRSYGAKLSPLAMAYMLTAIIVPSLGVTALISASSIMNFTESLAKTIFLVIFFISFMMQVLFALIIRAIRPNLISE